MSSRYLGDTTAEEIGFELSYLHEPRPQDGRDAETATRRKGNLLINVLMWEHRRCLRIRLLVRAEEDELGCLRHQVVPHQPLRKQYDSLGRVQDAHRRKTMPGQYNRFGLAW
jgi:hypothetical protein